MKKYRSALATALLTAVAVLGTLGFGVQNLAATNMEYTLGNLSGDYIITEHGTASDASIVAALGRLTFVADGSVSGWMTYQSASSNVTTTCTGNYTITPDGSGTLNLVHARTVPFGQAEVEHTTSATYRFLAFQSGTTGMELKAIRTENGQADSANLVRSKMVTVTSGLKGAFVFSEEGTLAAATDVAGLGMINFDGKGRVSGWETIQVSHRNMVTTFSGTYGFDPDGTGRLNLIHAAPALLEQAGWESPAVSAKYKFLVKVDVNGVPEVRAIRSENGIAVSSTFRTQAR